MAGFADSQLLKNDKNEDEDKDTIIGQYKNVLDDLVKYGYESVYKEKMDVVCNFLKKICGEENIQSLDKNKTDPEPEYNTSDLPSDVVSNNSYIFFIKFNNITSYKESGYVYKFYINLNKTIITNEVNRILTEKMKTDKRNIIYTTDLTQINKLDVNADDLYIIQIYDTKTNDFLDKFILCNENIVKEIDAAVANIDKSVVLRTTSENESLQNLVDNYYINDYKSDVKKIEGKIEDFLCKIKKYDKHLALKEKNVKTGNDAFYMPREYNDTTLENTSLENNGNIDKYCEVLFNKTKYATWNTHQVYQYTIDSNNAILLLFMNVMYKIKSKNGDLPENETKPLETDVFECINKSSKYKKEYNYKDNVENRIRCFHYYNNNSEMFFSKRYVASLTYDTKNDGNKLLKLINDIASVFSNVSVEENVKLLIEDEINIMIFKNLSHNLYIFDKSEFKQKEKIPDIPNTNTFADNFNLVSSFLYKLSYELYAPTQSQTFYYSKTPEINFSKGDVVYVRINYSTWAKSTITDIIYGQNAYEQTDIFYDEMSAINKDVDEDEVSPYLHNKVSGGGDEIENQPCYSQYIKVSFDDKENIDKKIQDNTDYIRVYGNVLPSQFFYEIDEPDEPDNKHKTFEYKYKLLYKNTFVKDRIENIQKSVKKYKKILMDIFKSVTGDYFNNKPESNNETNKHVFDSITFFVKYITEIDLYLFVLSSNTFVLPSNQKNIKQYSYKDKDAILEIKKKIKSKPVTLFTFVDDTDEAKKLFIPVSVFLDDYSLFSSNLEKITIEKTLFGNDFNETEKENTDKSGGGYNKTNKKYVLTRNKSVKNNKHSSNTTSTTHSNSIKNRSKYVTWN
jgi:hypothetical protein